MALRGLGADRCGPDVEHRAAHRQQSRGTRLPWELSRSMTGGVPTGSNRRNTNSGVTSGWVGVERGLAPARRRCSRRDRRPARGRGTSSRSAASGRVPVLRRECRLEAEGSRRCVRHVAVLGHAVRVVGVRRAGVGQDRLAGARRGKAPAVPGEQRLVSPQHARRGRFECLGHAVLDEPLVLERYRGPRAIEERVRADPLAERQPPIRLRVADVDRERRARCPPRTARPLAGQLGSHPTRAARRRSRPSSSEPSVDGVHPPEDLLASRERTSGRTTAMPAVWSAGRPCSSGPLTGCCLERPSTRRCSWPRSGA